MAETVLREDTKVLAFDEMDAMQRPPAPLTTERGTVTYDVPPEQRGQTLVIDFEEHSEPRSERPAVPCCRGAVQASLQHRGRRILCLHCAQVYQYGFRVDYRPEVRRQIRGQDAPPVDIWRR